MCKEKKNWELLIYASIFETIHPPAAWSSSYPGKAASLPSSQTKWRLSYVCYNSIFTKTLKLHY